LHRWWRFVSTLLTSLKNDSDLNMALLRTVYKPLTVLF
jgi:hypothetical protein